MEKQYITISEFGDVHTYIGAELPEAMIEASDDGIYDLMDITDPRKPLRHIDGEWQGVEYLPAF